MRQVNEERLATHKENLENAEKISKLTEQLNESKADIECMMTHQETLENKDK